MTPTQNLTIAVNLLWLVQGVGKAAQHHLAEYRKGSPAKFHDKKEEGAILDRLTDLLISSELLLTKKYNVNDEAIEAMTDIGYQVRHFCSRLLAESDPAQVHKMFCILEAAASDEVRVVDDRMQPCAYTITLDSGATTVISQDADGLWSCPLVAAKYKEPVYVVGKLESMGVLAPLAQVA